MTRTARYGFAAPLKWAAGRKIITIKAPGAASVVATQFKNYTDPTEYPLVVVQTDQSTWQFQTHAEVGGERVAAARVRLEAIAPDGTRVVLPDPAGPPRMFGRRTTLTIAMPGRLETEPYVEVLPNSVPSTLGTDQGAVLAADVDESPGIPVAVMVAGGVLAAASVALLGYKLLKT